MKKYFDVVLLCISILIIPACRFHPPRPVKGVIKNNTREELIGVEWDKFMADSLLCNDSIYLDEYLQPGLSLKLSTGHFREWDFIKLPDTTKQYFYFFNLDSLRKYQKLKICDGIVKRCLVKRIEIQLNKVIDPLDTIFINSSVPLN